MERKSLIPYNQTGELSASFGEVQPSGFWKRIVFIWQAKMFQVGKEEDGIVEREITFDPIFRYSGIKRNFENEFDRNAEGVRPTCYSLDGKTGSQPAIRRVLADGQEHSVYGLCKECKFNEWRSRGLWKPPGNYQQAKAKQCSQYTLILGMYKGDVCMIQIPSTGVESVNEGIQSVVTAKDKKFEEVKWQLKGTGGGFQGKYMKIVPVEFLSEEQIMELNTKRAECFDGFERAVIAFAQGGLDEENGGSTAGEGNVVNA